MVDDITAFFEGYRRALERGDVSAVAACYRTPLPVVRPDRTRVVENADLLGDEIRKIVDFYRWSGMARLEMPRLSVTTSESGLDLASLTWRPVTAAGDEIACIDVTFVVRRAAEGARIAAVVAHDEERRRLPILRETLSALDIAPPTVADASKLG